MSKRMKLMNGAIFMNYIYATLIQIFSIKILMQQIRQAKEKLNTCLSSKVFLIREKSLVDLSNLAAILDGQFYIGNLNAANRCFAGINFIRVKFEKLFAREVALNYCLFIIMRVKIET